MPTARPAARCFVPFGSHWAMGIEVPYSLGVIEAGRFWSCGQCPLDLAANLRAPGDLDGQLRIVAGLIREQFTPHGITPDRIGKLVAYSAPDGRTGLERTEAILREELPGAPVVVVLGVPHFYYAGMMVEIDVHASVDAQPIASAAELGRGASVSIARCGDEVHAAVSLDRDADGRAALDALMRGPCSGTRVLSARVFASADAAGSTLLAETVARLGGDPGMTVIADLPFGRAIVADLILDHADGGEGERASPTRHGDVVLVERRAGPFLSLMGRKAGAPAALAETTRTILETFRGRLASHGLDFASVVKQQTYYVGGASEDDLYANMRVRNGCYERPGPASTGLAVASFADADCAITVELIATPRRQTS